MKTMKWIKGVDHLGQKYWLSDCGRYRIYDGYRSGLVMCSSYLRYVCQHMTNRNHGFTCMRWTHGHEYVVFHTVADAKRFFEGTELLYADY